MREAARAAHAVTCYLSNSPLLSGQGVCGCPPRRLLTFLRASCGSDCSSWYGYPRDSNCTSNKRQWMDHRSDFGSRLMYVHGNDALRDPLAVFEVPKRSRMQGDPHGKRCPSRHSELSMYVPVCLSYRSTLHTRALATNHQLQQQKQQLAASKESHHASLPEGVAYPADYAAMGASSRSNSSSVSSSGSSTTATINDKRGRAVEQMDMLPAWARRVLPPHREVLFLRIIPVAPLVGMALGVHILPPLGLGYLARDCLSALIAYSAALLTANAAVHAGLQLAEFGFPAQRQHRGFYIVGRLGVSLFFVVHSLLVCGLLHDEPLHGIYLCCASCVGLLGVDWLLFKKSTMPVWYADSSVLRAELIWCRYVPSGAAQSLLVDVGG
ncbi:uncharacterized protein LOC113147549 [Cyclospora cayetanensis]|uniref:Uncharacterized protein LOC113147549 n=1 Tax=Cyclospora cayetanensis TaxID=88456 RepID=A0A6P6S261_9EIME|nr:uncharacterized protein LOC113147549 [Cyclospora cayetanensis]